MKKYIFNFLLANATLIPVIANTTTEIIEQTQSSSVLGKYKVVQEDFQILKNGKVIKSTSTNVENGLIYHFKSAKLVTIIFDPNEEGIDFTIDRKANDYHIYNEYGQSEDDFLILKKKTPELVIFVREAPDVDDDDKEILVRTTFHMKRIK